MSGGHVLPGYLNDPESDRQNKIHEGDRVWHRTGDGGRIDAQGRLWLMGRVSRCVRRGGIEWWPLPAELRAMNVPGVAHAAYVGRPMPDGSSRAVLCVEPRGPRAGSPTREALVAALAPWPVDEWVVLDHIPRDPRHQSKTDHEALLRILESHA